MASSPNELEIAVLERLALAAPPLRSAIGDLCVLRRELTGAGSFTYFEPVFPVPLPDGYLTLDSLITVPGIPNGMGAALAMVSGHPQFLELFTYGDDSWSGVFSGFSIAPGA